ncbi:MAG: hypothetical protein V1696_03645 [Candidatus Jorgensenbacteria bacterium]
MRRINTKIKLLVVLSFILVFFRVEAASAATLFLSPATGSYDSGQTFSVGVFVASKDAAMNAASGVISFPQDKLEILSLSRTGSIMSLWAQEPSFSNAVGTVNFEGIVLNPGFQGTAGKLLSITFRVKAAGSAAVSFASGSVLANDGKGTNILQEFGNAQFGLKVPAEGLQAGEGTTPVSILGAPLAPVIGSPTHPNPDGWYANRDPKFSWVIPSGVTAVRLVYDTSPRSIPSVVYAPPIIEKELKDVGDGIYYFHAQFRNEEGWGSIAHFRFQIDTKPPEKFTIRFVGDPKLTSPRPVVLFDTTDALSGIDFYKVKVGDRDSFSVQSDEMKGNPYTLPPQDPGKHTILVQVFDRAGNYETALADFTIATIEAPTITDYPATLAPGEYLVVKGKTYPAAAVTVWLEQKGVAPKIYTGTSDPQGFFTVAGDGLIEPGVYELWAEVTDSRGARSTPSEKYTVAVESPRIVRIGSFAINILTITVTVVALFALLGGISWFAWRKVFGGVRRKVEKGVQEAERDIHRRFDKLRDDVRKHVHLLERVRTKRELTEEEHKILEQLKRDLDSAEEAVKGEIEEIKREVR